MELVSESSRPNFEILTARMEERKRTPRWIIDVPSLRLDANNTCLAANNDHHPIMAKMLEMVSNRFEFCKYRWGLMEAAAGKDYALPVGWAKGGRAFIQVLHPTRRHVFVYKNCCQIQKEQYTFSAVCPFLIRADIPSLSHSSPCLQFMFSAMMPRFACRRR